MNLKKLIIGNALTFCREGDTIDAITVSSSAKPDHVPTTNWTKAGDIEEFTPTPKLTEEPIFTPSPGNYQRSEILVKQSELTLAFVVQDMSDLFFEMLFLSTKLVAGAGAPLTASGQLKGWWHVDMYDQSNALVNTLEVYGRAKVSAAKFGNNHAKGSIEIDVLANALNTLASSLG